MKPHVKLAFTMVLIGSGLITLERYGLSEFAGSGGTAPHIDPNLLSLLVLVPVGLILVGCAVFVIGTMRRR